NNLREGYIEQINLPKGIYAGKSIVSNNNGRAYIFAINTREDDVTVEVPVVPLFPFETSDDENKNEPKNAPLSTINARDRVEKVIIIKKLIKRKRGRSRKKRTHKPHTNLPNIVLTFDSTDSNTDKYNLIKKKPRIKSDSENTDNDNYDTSDSETSENTTSDSDDTPHYVEKIQKGTEKKNQIKQTEDCHVKLDHSYAADRNKTHTLQHSPPYSSDKKTSKKIRIISESEVESINVDSNNDNEHILALKTPLPPSHSSSETETASENENNNRESYPQRTASINNNVEEQSLPIKPRNPVRWP
ncbi:hypothetical protein PV328_012327, partial [Microctonus aethiopoides]